MILDQNVEQRFHNINSDPVSTHWNLVSTHTHAMRLTQNETRNINFQFGTVPCVKVDLKNKTMSRITSGSLCHNGRFPQLGKQIVSSQNL